MSIENPLEQPTDRMRPIGRSELKLMLIEEFELPSSVGEDSRLAEDLEFDSLKIIELVAFVEQSADQCSDGFPRIETLSDALNYYDELMSGPTNGIEA